MVHQSIQISAHAFTGMGTPNGKNLPAYVMATGNPASAKNINTEGLRRRGFDKDVIATLQKAFKIIYRSGLTVDEAMAELKVMRADCADRKRVEWGRGGRGGGGRHVC